MEKEITNFELRYDGMYHIEWTEGDKVNKWYLYLSIPDILRMLKIEGLTYEELVNPEYQYSPIKFKKVKLRYTLEDGYILAYGFFDEYLGNTLKESFTVELFAGDTIKNHQHETILGNVELVDEKYYEEWQNAVNSKSK